MAASADGIVFRDWDIDSLRIARQIDYEVNANWKLIFQNYSECYHCPTVHPVLNRLTPFRDSSNDLTEGAILGGPMSLSQDSQTMSNDGKFAGMLLPSLEFATVAGGALLHDLSIAVFELASGLCLDSPNRTNEQATNPGCLPISVSSKFVMGRRILILRVQLNSGI